MDWRSRYEALQQYVEPPADVVATEHTETAQSEMWRKAAEHTADVAAAAQSELRRAEQALASLAAKFQKTEAELARVREQLATRQVAEPAAPVHECIPDHALWNRSDWGYPW